MAQPSKLEITRWLLGALDQAMARSGCRAGDAAGEDVAFRELGLDSAHGARLIGELSAWLGRELEVALLYDYPTVRALAQALCGVPAPHPTERAVREADAIPIAIVGIGCRFSGVDGVAELWRVLRDNECTIRPFPDDRLELPQARHWQDLASTGRTGACFTQGGFVSGIDRFDAAFFGISSAEAERMDPQQRMLLEVTYEAFVDAAIAPSSVRSTQTGVYVGISSADYGVDQWSVPSEVDLLTGTGNAASIAANRLSYYFDLRGPSIAFDTACSSSLVAVHEACNALRRGDVARAVVAGVNAILSPAITVNFERAGVMAADARCKTFAANADGYVRAEGAGVLILRPLAAALAAGDRVYAVILGGAVGHGGKTNGLMSPSGAAQGYVFQEAMADAGIKARDIDYVEAHGTGTFIGDPIEANALGRALSAGLGRSRKCGLGSIKTNIGHTEAAAGIAGVIKVALALHHRLIPASLHSEPPNEHIHFDTLPIRVPNRNEPWPGRVGNGCASVASVGFGGTICHVVLSEAQHPVAQKRSGAFDLPPLAAADGDRPWLLPISAATAPGLSRAVLQWTETIRARIEDNKLGELRFHTDRATWGRDSHVHRVAATAQSAPALLAILEAKAQLPVNGTPLGAPQVVFVCPGQGSQWLGMGRRLLATEAAFRQAFVLCSDALLPHMKRSIVDLIMDDSDTSLPSDIALVQPTLFAFEVALAALFNERGITPAATIGHSMGEVAAAHISGALSLEDGARIIALRSLLMKKCRGGMMALVELPVAQAQEALLPYRGRISVAAINSARTTVVSGDADAIEKLLGELVLKGVFCRPIRVEVASHSAHVDPICAELRSLLAPVRPLAPSVPMWSTVLGRWVQGAELDADYWVRNLRDTVEFSAGVRAIAAAHSQVFLELSPHPILLAAVEDSLSDSSLPCVAFGALRRDRDECLSIAETLADLFESGVDIRWPILRHADTTAAGWAPNYPWERQRYWWFPDRAEKTQAPRVRVADGADGPEWESDGWWANPRVLASDPAIRTWETTANASSCGLMADHRVAGKIVLPGALLLALAARAGAVALDVASSGVELQSVSFLAPIVLDRARRIQVVFTDEERTLEQRHGKGLVRIFEREDERGASWTLCAEARVRNGSSAKRTQLPRLDLPRRTAAEAEHVDARTLYGDLLRVGLEYGPNFRAIKSTWVHRAAALGHAIASVPVAAASVGAHSLHPALLDASFHVAWLALDAEERARALQTGRALVPASAEHVMLGFAPAAPSPDLGTCWSVAERQLDGSVDVTVFDAMGGVRAALLGLRFAAVDSHSFAGRGLQGACFDVEWQDRPSAGLDPSLKSWTVVSSVPNALSERICEHLRAHGMHVTEVTSGAEAPDAVEQTGAQHGGGQDTLQHLVFVPACGVHALPDDWASFRREQAADTRALAALVLSDIARKPVALSIVTCGVGAVDALSTSVAHGQLWGLGRVIAAEVPRLQVRLIDADCGRPDEVARQLVRELLAAVPEAEIVLHKGRRLVPQLAPRTLPVASNAERLSGAATYLITGGGGALGGMLAKRFVDAGAGAVLLCGRRDFPDASVADWLRTEARARYCPLDVTDLAAVRTLVDSVAGSALQLKGVVHAAGVLKDGTLENLSPDEFELVMAPKRDGLWNLHDATQHLSLDFFVAYSSVTALVGSPGQANYAAANAFMDQLCRARRAAKLPALSVSWGPWAEVGLAARAHRGGRLETLGLRSIDPHDGVECVFGMIAERMQGLCVVLPTDASKLRSTGALSHSAMMAALLAEPVALSREAPAPEPATRRERGDGPEWADLEGFLQRQLAVVLRRTPTEVGVETPFPQFGLESLAVLQFKNRLETSLGVVIPAMVVWKHPTIRSLARRLEEELGRSCSSGGQA